jgi:hypothetical protein
VTPQAIRAERERRAIRNEQERRRIARALVGASYDDWLHTLFPGGKPLAAHHHDFWAHVWTIEAEAAAPAFVVIWPRGGAKSTNLERSVVALGARQRRRYVLYISGTQRQADKHVQSIAGMLERRRIGAAYPELGARAVGKYGHSKGWRGNRLRTASGLTVDALGLDSALRGAKVDEDRPDLIVLDDIDDKFDTPAATQKKIDIVTNSILPSGAPEAIVLAGQNLIHPNSIFAQLADNRAGFLLDRIVSGPHPALRDFQYTFVPGAPGKPQQYRITEGEPTWVGQDIATCQRFINTWGLTAFLNECQHAVEAPAGGMYDHIVFQRITRDDLPALVRVVVWCDPAVTATDNSDHNGIQVDGIDAHERIYRLWSWEQRSTPVETLRRALRKAVEWKAEHVGVETDQGGDTWESVYNEAWRTLLADGSIDAATPRPRFRSAKAGAGHGGKTERQMRVLADYETAKIWHLVGTHDTLERALRRFPKSKPLDLADAGYWSWWHVKRRKKVARSYGGGTYTDDD